MIFTVRRDAHAARPEFLFLIQSLFSRERDTDKYFNTSATAQTHGALAVHRTAATGGGGDGGETMKHCRKVNHLNERLTAV